jgi:hypothetical protein
VALVVTAFGVIGLFQSFGCSVQSGFGVSKKLQRYLSLHLGEPTSLPYTLDGVFNDAQQLLLIHRRNDAS